MQVSNEDDNIKKLFDEHFEEWQTYNVPVLPVPYGLGHPIIDWKGYQTNPPTNYKQFSFEDVCVMPGPTTDGLRNLVVLDSDTAEATNKLLDILGCTLEQLAAKTRVERHPGTPYKLHTFFFSKLEFESKTSFRKDNVFKLETRADRQYLVNVAPSINAKDKTRYEVVGTHKIADAGLELRELLKRFYAETNEPYADNGVMKTKSDYIAFNFANNRSAHDEFYLDLKEKITSHRNDTLRDIFSIYVSDHWGNTKESMIEWALRYNDRNCATPLQGDEIIGIINSRLKYIGNCKEEEKKENRVTKQDIEFVIDTMTKEAKHDRMSIKQTFHGFNSGFTKMVLHGSMNSKNAGSGKNYIVSKVSDYYPRKYVLELQGASDKAFQHKDGITVLEDKDTGELTETAPIIDKLNLEILALEGDLEGTEDKSVIKSLKGQIRGKEYEIKKILEDQIKLIVLTDTIVIFLDTPGEGVTDNLMSILSNDTTGDQKYFFAEKSSSNKMGAKYNILRGTPVVFVTRVIDDSRNARFEEKNRRFVNINPNVSQAKIEDANTLMWEQCGLTSEEYGETVVSREDKEKAKRIVSNLVEKLRNHSKYLGSKEFGIKIPYLYSIYVPSKSVWGMTVTDRMRKYLAIITKENMDSRPRLVRKDNPRIFLPISTFEDMKDTLELMEIAGSNVRPYLADWYNDKFLDILEKEDGVKSEEKDGKTLTEEYVSVTAKQLCEITNCSNEELRHKYIDPLVNQGIINKATSNIRRNENVYWAADSTGENIFSLFSGDDIRLHIKYPRLWPTKNFLMEMFGDKGGVEKNILDIYRLEDENGLELTPKELVDRYFPHPEICFKPDFDYIREPVDLVTHLDYHSEVFGDMIYLGKKIKKIYAPLVAEDFAGHSNNITSEMGYEK